MANPEHLQILQQGVEAWNAWQEQHYGDDITPDLTGADLTGADLTFASLIDADLTGANPSHGQLLSTIFGNTNLTAVQGLETCFHLRPSIFDSRVLARSGPLPLAFLRGCGLPERLIEYLPSILNEPLQF